MAKTLSLEKLHAMKKESGKKVRGLTHCSHILQGELATKTGGRKLKEKKLKIGIKCLSLEIDRARVMGKFQAIMGRAVYGLRHREVRQKKISKVLKKESKEMKEIREQEEYVAMVTDDIITRIRHSPAPIAIEKELDKLLAIRESPLATSTPMDVERIFLEEQQDVIMKTLRAPPSSPSKLERNIRPEQMEVTVDLEEVRVRVEEIKNLKMT